MHTSQFKGIVFGEISEVMSALSEPKRLEILDFLCQCERSVENLATLMDVKLNTMSHHLQVLRRANLVSDRREGRHVLYRATEFALRLWDSISEITSKELSRIKWATHEVLDAPESAEAVDADELKRKVSANEAVVIDVRPGEEYEAAHFPGALSVPLPELSEKLAKLPRDKEIIAYCRGRYCVLSYEAARLLRQHGLKSIRLPIGMTEWKATNTKLEYGNEGEVL